jgi:SAM-dependent methyltransferase
MCLDGIKKGRLLDVGCGNGSFLAMMRDAGWDVQGVEPDPVGGRIAQERFGVPVIVGTLAEARLNDQSFDAVTLSHVIEHVHNPVALLQECHRVLKPGGRLVVVTPNVESRGHQVFGEHWRDLDPPRHLYLFSLRTLRICAAKSGLDINALRTSSRSARLIWAVSRTIDNKGRFSDSDVTWRLRIKGLAFQAREMVALRASEGAGEELILIGLRSV